MTLTDVARRAGVSTAVVSYVLNDGPRPVSDALRTRVRAAIAELDYRPNQVARAMRRPRRWGQIGLLVPDVSLPLFGQLAGHLEAAARRRELLAVTGNAGFDARTERDFARAFVEAGVQGLVVVGGADATEVSRCCARDRTPVVFVHNSRGAGDAALVRSDHVAAGALATRHLLDGHALDDVVFVGGIDGDEVAYGDHETARERFDGYRSVVGAGAARRIVTDLSVPGAYHAVRDHLAVQPPPSGLVVGTQQQVQAVLRAVLDAGLRVPDDVAVVTFDGDLRDAYAPRVPTTVQQRVEEIAEAALDRLVGRGDPHEAGIALDSLLHTGDTCGCPALG